MDPVQKAWMFENWLADQKDNAELAKNHAYLLASFWNPEAVKQILGEGVSTHESSSEDFEESTRMIREINKKNEEKTSIKRKRRNLKE